MHSIRVLLPEPLTPEIAVIAPNGIFTEMFLRLFFTRLFSSKKLFPLLISNALCSASQRVFLPAK